jgi:hypothetical protein
MTTANISVEGEPVGGEKPKEHQVRKLTPPLTNLKRENTIHYGQLTLTHSRAFQGPVIITEPQPDGPPSILVTTEPGCKTIFAYHGMKITIDHQG